MIPELEQAKTFHALDRMATVETKFVFMGKKLCMSTEIIF
jgi:hypothetical protein